MRSTRYENTLFYEFSESDIRYITNTSILKFSLYKENQFSLNLKVTSLRNPR